ncbi:hypothetical protein EJB05_02741 [Eragrostis curvula]|uniref:Uncharacterized protein n=1 Tax=Eragrostis curvula TaxID=38414 RepID=A0A5J9WT92_9POAL|nr:hypothetical protein EJB05_02741 [Eragrostis curvula]
MAHWLGQAIAEVPEKRRFFASCRADGGLAYIVLGASVVNFPQEPNTRGVAVGGLVVWEENDNVVEQEGKSHSNRSCSTYVKICS